MTDDEICKAIKIGTVIGLTDIGNEWEGIPLLLGVDGSGHKVLVFYVVDTDRGLPRDIASAGDGVRRRKLHEEVQPYALRGQNAKTGTVPAGTQVSLQGIATVICAS
jgi:hypothetical protein